MTTRVLGPCWDVELPMVQKFVLICLADNANDDWVAHPSVDGKEAFRSISKRTGMGGSTIRRALIELENAGYLTRHHRAGKVTLYELNRDKIMQVHFDYEAEAKAARNARKALPKRAGSSDESASKPQPEREANQSGRPPGESESPPAPGESPPAASATPPAAGGEPSLTVINRHEPGERAPARLSGSDTPPDPRLGITPGIRSAIPPDFTLSDDTRTQCAIHALGDPDAFVEKFKTLATAYGWRVENWQAKFRLELPKETRGDAAGGSHAAGKQTRFERDSEQLERFEREAAGSEFGSG